MKFEESMPQNVTGVTTFLISVKNRMQTTQKHSQ